MSPIVKILIAAIGGFGLTFLAKLGIVATDMSDTDTLASISTKEWIGIFGPALTAMISTVVGYVMKSPNDLRLPKSAAAIVFALFMAPILISLPGCGSMNLKDQPRVYQTGIKLVTVAGIDKAAKTEEGKKAVAATVIDAVDKVVIYVDGTTGSISKDVIMDKFRAALGGANMPVYYKVIIDELATELDDAYQLSNNLGSKLPDIKIDETFKSNVKLIMKNIRVAAGYF